MIRTIISQLVACALFAPVVFGTIRTVSRDGSADFTAIQPALNACAAGDTVVVRGENSSFSGNDTVRVRTVLIGAGNGCHSIAGSIKTELLYFASGSSGSTVEGFRIQDEGIIIAPYVTGITIRRCRLDTGDGVDVGKYGAAAIEECRLSYGTSADSFATVSIRNSMANGSSSIAMLWLSYGATGTLINNLFSTSSNSYIFTCNSTATLNMDHNIFWPSTWNGNVGSVGSVNSSYNVISGTAALYFPGSNNIVIAADPFEIYGSGYTDCTDDLHLTVASGLIDAGDPGAALDRDGSRRDPGPLGGPYPFVNNMAPDFPFVVASGVSATIPQNGVLEVRATGRVGRGE